MKKILIALLLSLIVCITYAQTSADSSKHLTFKGVPIDGTLDQYVLKMKLNGFTHLGTEDGTEMLQGDFAGYKDCYVGVSTLKQKDLVHNIGVRFPAKDTWSTLSGNYHELKQLLTEKYGKPSEVVEKFDTQFQPRDDGNKMYEVRVNRCKYYSLWRTEMGEIHLSIDHKSVYGCFVKLAYFDKINSATIKKTALDDL